jgi:hypothetical protein
MALTLVVLDPAASPASPLFLKEIQFPIKGISVLSFIPWHFSLGGSEGSEGSVGSEGFVVVGSHREVSSAAETMGETNRTLPINREPTI